MPSAWSDLSRPPISGARIAQALRDDPLWRDVRVVTATASTNADVATEARTGAPEGLAIVAEEQLGGRGRLGRNWVSPARAGVLMSVLLRPQTDVTTWSLLPLIAGLAVVEAVESVGQVEAMLKWPNDVTVDGLKLAGILAERVGSAVVIGIGLNVSTRGDELPVGTATSLAIAGGVTDRESLVKEILRALSRRYVAWRDTSGAASAVLPAYRERCETIGQHVDVHLPGGEIMRGFVTGVDDAGGLLVRDGASGDEQAVLAGDVIHVRKVG
jgi:BirA family biotin operon repressor/biotin-[acetyl-CoA-carboxylase] ligase